jgi:hypothetical protein
MGDRTIQNRDRNLAAGTLGSGADRNVKSETQTLQRSGGSGSPKPTLAYGQTECPASRIFALARGLGDHLSPFRTVRDNLVIA